MSTSRKKPITSKIKKPTKAETVGTSINNCNFEFTVFKTEDIDMLNNLINTINTGNLALLNITKVLTCIDIQSGISIHGSGVSMCNTNILA